MAMKKMLCLLGLGLVACAANDPSPAEISSALAQVEKELHNFHVANEWHYYETREYTADLARLFGEDGVDRTYPDSVRIEVLAVENDWYRVRGTHVRLGSSFGCAFAWGEFEGSLSTPGGLSFEGGNQILCDASGEPGES